MAPGGCTDPDCKFDHLCYIHMVSSHGVYCCYTVLDHFKNKQNSIGPGKRARPTKNNNFPNTYPSGGRRGGRGYGGQQRQQRSPQQQQQGQGGSNNGQAQASQGQDAGKKSITVDGVTYYARD